MAVIGSAEAHMILDFKLALYAQVVVRINFLDDALSSQINRGHLAQPKLSDVWENAQMTLHKPNGIENTLDANEGKMISRRSTSPDVKEKVRLLASATVSASADCGTYIRQQKSCRNHASHTPLDQCRTRKLPSIRPWVKLCIDWSHPGNQR